MNKLKASVREIVQTFLMPTEKVRLVKDFHILYEGTVEHIFEDMPEEILDDQVSIISVADRTLILSLKRGGM